MVVPTWKISGNWAQGAVREKSDAIHTPYPLTTGVCCAQYCCTSWTQICLHAYTQAQVPWRGTANFVMIDHLFSTPPSETLFYLFLSFHEGLKLKQTSSEAGWRILFYLIHFAVPHTSTDRKGERKRCLIAIQKCCTIHFRRRSICRADTGISSFNYQVRQITNPGCRFFH